MTIVYLALGSNVGKSITYINKAIELLGEKVFSILSAPLYTSKAYGYTKQPDFINTAVSGATDLSPDELLVFVKNIEKKLGRIERFRWGPREIDIDIIFYGDQIVDSKDLSIPHIDFMNRDFVLKPLCDLNPDFVDPRTKKTLAELYDRLPKDSLVIYKDL